MASGADARRALVDTLAVELEALVLSGELQSGTRLRQEALALRFGVSRTPVREALRKLQAAGLVELLPNRGAVVRALSTREIRDAYEVRAELEALAAGLAAQRIRQEQIGLLEDAQRLFREAYERTAAAREDGRPADVSPEDSEMWGRANDQFHRLIHQASGNDVLVRALADLHQSVPRDLRRTVLSESTSLLLENVTEHASIAAAIVRRDEVAAHALMHEHVRNAGRLVTLRYEQRYAV